VAHVNLFIHSEGSLSAAAAAAPLPGGAAAMLGHLRCAGLWNPSLGPNRSTSDASQHQHTHPIYVESFLALHRLPSAAAIHTCLTAGTFNNNVAGARRDWPRRLLP
jgi:hypothetical protein